MRPFRIAVAALLLAVPGCVEMPAAPMETEDSSHLLSTARSSFLTCPSNAEASTTGDIGPLGGTLEVDGHRFTLPPLAVTKTTTFTMTAPASNYVELLIHAEGHDSFTFLLPAEITISYDRCNRQNIEHDALTVWYISRLTGLLLENMGGTADAEARAITFHSGHLSGFIIAN